MHLSGQRLVHIVHTLGWRGLLGLHRDPFPQTLWLIAIHASGPTEVQTAGRLGAGERLCRDNRALEGPQLRLKRPVCQRLEDRACRARSVCCFLCHLSMSAALAPT